MRCRTFTCIAGNEASHISIAHDTVLRIYLVRHGETNENRAGIVQGQLDTELNKDGIFQSDLCAEALKDVNFVVAFTSDLKRTVDTASIIMKYHPDVELLKDPGLRERHMGELQGARGGSFDRRRLPPSVESDTAFSNRVSEWWKTVIEQHLPSIPLVSEVQDVLVVSHGAYINTLCHILVANGTIVMDPGIRWEPCYNTSISIIEMQRDKRGKLVKYSDISHLLSAEDIVETNADEQTETPD